MKIKANVSFAGAELSMYAGEIRECDDEIALSNLIKAGYIEKIAPVQEHDEEKQEDDNVEKEVPADSEKPKEVEDDNGEKEAPADSVKAKKKKVAKSEGKGAK